jgi:hypothetical protein
MQQTHNPVAEFHEEQQFRQPWVWLLLLAITLWLTIMFAHGLYTQLYLEQPWGDRPMSNTGLVVSATISLFITAGLALLFYKLKLVTVVGTDGIHVRFFPLTSRKISFADITSCKARTYRPIREYGGWGIRYSRKGKAYNVSGDRGVQLEFREGRPLLIGSQRAEELADVINKHLQ